MTDASNSIMLKTMCKKKKKAHIIGKYVKNRDSTVNVVL